MEWLIGIAGGLILCGLVFGSVVSNIWIVAITTAAGIIIVTAGSCYQKKQAEAIEHKRLSQYPSYKY